MYTYFLFLASTVLLWQTGCVHAQILSCKDLGSSCPIGDASSLCYLQGQFLNVIGVVDISTVASVQELSWTVGYIPSSGGNGVVVPDSREFYLGQPLSVNLQNNKTIMACALFFDGIASKLSFNSSETVRGASGSRGTCADALTASCAADWTQQAQDVASQLTDTDFSCQRLADELRSQPPASCTMAKKSWGAVAARNISGSSVPPPLSLGNCNPSINSTYSVTHIHSVNGSSKTEWSLDYITPVFTVMRPLGGGVNPSTDVVLSCLKPVFDRNISDTGYLTSSATTQRRSLIDLLLLAVAIASLLL